MVHMLDLAPDWSAVARSGGRLGGDPWAKGNRTTGGTSVITFDQLLGMDVIDAPRLFTCERRVNKGLPQMPPRIAPWPHRRAAPDSPTPLDATRSASSRHYRHGHQLTFADVAIGILVAGKPELVRSGSVAVTDPSVGSVPGSISGWAQSPVMQSKAPTDDLAALRKLCEWGTSGRSRSNERGYIKGGASSLPDHSSPAQEPERHAAMVASAREWRRSR